MPQASELSALAQKCPIKTQEVVAVFLEDNNILAAQRALLSAIDECFRVKSITPEEAVEAYKIIDLQEEEMAHVRRRYGPKR